MKTKRIFTNVILVVFILIPLLANAHGFIEVTVPSATSKDSLISWNKVLLNTSKVKSFRAAGAFTVPGTDKEMLCTTNEEITRIDLIGKTVMYVRETFQEVKALIMEHTHQ